MGSFNSIEAKDKKKEDLLFDIEIKGNRLNRLYTEKFLDPDFCNQVTMVNTDDLVRFQHQKVGSKQYSFGYIGDVPTVKEKICDGIQEEYRLKKELVSTILTCFQECNSRLDSVTKGPMCRGNPEIFNEVDCTPPSEWVHTVVPPEEGVSENKKWYTSMTDYHDYFMKNVTILQNILNDLESHDERFSIDRVQEMIRTVDKIKLSLNHECSRLQRYVLTIPTFTDQEIIEQVKIDSENQGRVEAKRAALLNGNNVAI